MDLSAPGEVLVDSYERMIVGDMTDPADSPRPTGLCRAPWSGIVIGLVTLYVAAIAFIPGGTSCIETVGPPPVEL